MQTLPNGNAVRIKEKILTRKWIALRGGMWIVTATGEGTRWVKFQKKEPLALTYSPADQRVQRIFDYMRAIISFQWRYTNFWSEFKRSFGLVE